LPLRELLFATMPAILSGWVMFTPMSPPFLVMRRNLRRVRQAVISLTQPTSYCHPMNDAVFRTLIDPVTLQSKLSDPQWIIIDCRFELGKPDAGRLAWQQAHLPGARYADLERDLSGPATATSGRHPLPDISSLSHCLGNWGITERTQVITYDAENGSMAAARLWWLLRWLGHERVAVLDGGIKAWCAADLPLDDKPVHAVPGQFTARPHHDWVLNAGDVRERLNDPGWRLVDARTAERYAGLVEPIDPVAGHIPGAINHPLACNLQADGRFLSPETLRTLWHMELDDVEVAHVVNSCGSGVTACHNLLALEVAGFSGAKLYAGSWSEWCKQPGYPVQTSKTRMKPQ
jgi:thiosulfate/3-mercaptopyruvate sulfurtransferase